MLSFLKSATASLVSNVQQAAAQPIQVGDRTVVVKEQLGEGGFAYVALVTDTSSSQEMAMKRMLCQDRESREIAETEIAVLKQLKGHPHIVNYIASSRRENTQSSIKSVEYFILMELCTRGSLIDLIKRRNGLKLGEIQVCELFTQICRGVSHMHGQNPPIAHRDLKIENVLINARGELRLCDFGSSTTRAKAYVSQREIVEEEERIGKYSTAMYRAPELVEIASAIGKRTVINEKVDIWALGCILYTIAFFTQPFQEGGNLQILSGSYDVPEGHPFSKYLTALIKRLLTVDPVKRPDITQVLALCGQWHAWLKGGGVALAKPSASRSVSSQDGAAGAAAKGPLPSHSVTDPAQLHRNHSAEASATGSSAAAAAAAAAKEAKRARKERKARAAAAASPKAAADANDDWADFGSFAAAPAPTASPPAPAKRGPASPAKPGHSSASDSSSDDEDAGPRLAKKSSNSQLRSPPSTSSSSSSRPAASRSPAPAAQPATASLFDTSFFASPPVPSAAPTSASSAKPAASAASSWEASFESAGADGEWDAFGSGSTASSSSSAARASTTSTSPPAPAPLNFDDFDFSGFHSSPSPLAAAAAASPKSPHSGGGARRSRHGDKKDETIDLSKLAVGSASKSKSRAQAGSDSDSDVDTRPKIGKIKLGKAASSGSGGR